MTLQRKIIALMFLISLCGPSCMLHADDELEQTPDESGVTYTGELTYVDINNPFVLRVANFAADAIQRGSLYKVITAQVKGLKDWIYIFLIEVVDAYGRHHRYNVQVYVPSDGSAWQLVYFTAVNY